MTQRANHGDSGTVHVVRSASLRGFADLVSSFGGDAEAIVRRAGVPVEALHADEVLMPEDGSARAFELAARSLRVPDFGLRLSDYQDLSGLGPLALAIRNSPTLGEALEDARRFLWLHHQGSTMSVEPDPYEMRGLEGLRYASAVDPATYPQAADNALLNLHRVVLLLAGGDYGLRSVELSYRPSAPAGRHEEAFGGVRVNAGQPLTMLRIPSSARLMPVDDAQSGLRDVALEYLSSQPAPPGSATTVRARAVVEALIGSGRVTLPVIARNLELTTRTLQRRLADEGTSVAALLEAVRENKAQMLLTDASLSMSQVAAELEFSDQATLSRAARRWWAMSPTAKRRELLDLMPSA